MHSRIIELSKDPILKHERMCESSVPDWFYHSIADYTDADTDRDHDIKWFLDAVARVVDVAEDGKSFTFKPKAKQKYFERQYHAFLDKACELTGISLDAFVGEAKYDIGMAMYKLNEHYQDKFSLYVYFNDELKSLDEWIRETDLSGSFILAEPWIITIERSPVNYGIVSFEDPVSGLPAVLLLQLPRSFRHAVYRYRQAGA